MFAFGSLIHSLRQFLTIPYLGGCGLCQVFSVNSYQQSLSFLLDVIAPYPLLQSIIIDH